MSSVFCARCFQWRCLIGLAIIVTSGVVIGSAGCTRTEPPVAAAPAASAEPATPPEVEPIVKVELPDLIPSATDPSAADDTGSAEEIPLFATNSPFESDDEAPKAAKEKQLWARSFRWARAPDFVVERWLSDEPDMEGKYVLIEYWATWCGPCRRSIPLLNRLQEKYGDELVVIGVSDETKEDVLKMEEPKIEFFSAVDTQGRMKNELGVVGVPHVTILDPDGYVIWEGFPLLEGYELTEEIIEKILEVGRKLRAESDSSD